jgi:hypothetical protein
LLSSFDFDSFDTCESCLLGKMTKAPFTGQSERANVLLGLVDIEVCGPMSSVARGGFQYFNTFTDYFSRYGYIVTPCFSQKNKTLGTIYLNKSSCLLHGMLMHILLSGEVLLHTL